MPFRLRLRSGPRPSRVVSGHLWAYRTEIGGIASAPPGAVVDLFDSANRFVGRGYANPRSEIAFRLLTRRREEIDEAFFRRRLEAARALRAAEGLAGEPCRVVFSEGDLLPGFVADRYPLRDGAGAGVLVVQIGTAGAEALRGPFFEALSALYTGDSILERSDLPSRSKEGLPSRVEPVRGDPPPVVETAFDGVPASIDVARGQKTGAFLDAREMRRALRGGASGARVLDVFAHIGLFARYARAGGAASVTAVETDAAAAAALRAAVPGAEVVEENAFDVLRRFEKEGRTFDRVVLDPPPFTKDAKSVAGATRGYKEINLRALRLLAPGGLLFTSSCSYHLSREAFFEVLRSAAADARRDARLLRTFQAAPDHPVHLFVPETDYFKGALLCAG